MAAKNETYSLYVRNLKSFVESLPKTKIQFLYFHASDLTTPRMKETFGEWKIGAESVYVIHGVDYNYVYVYKQSDLKLLLANVRPCKNARSNTSYVVNVMNANISYDTNIGNHIDLSIHANKRDNKVFIKSHAAEYDLDVITMSFRRNADACNFTLTPENLALINQSISKFQELKCEDRFGNTLMNTTVNSIYNPPNHKNDLYVVIIHELCSIITSSRVNGGQTKRKRKPEKYKYKAKYYTVNYGSRGGSYITIDNGRKIYLKQKQKGGNKQFTDDKFIRFLGTNIVSKVAEKINPPDYLTGVQVIHDEDNAYCTFVYEFQEDKRTIFNVDINMLYEAYIASISKEKEDTYKTFMEDIMETMSYEPRITLSCTSE
jgi:hypothetical protein